MKKQNGLTAVVAVIAAMGVLAFTGLTQNAGAKTVGYVYGDGLVISGSGTLTGSLSAASLTATGSVTLPAGSIDTTKITGTFIGSDLAAASIDSTKVTSTFFSTEMAANTIDTTKISGTWLAADITNGVLDTTKLLNSGISGTGTLLCYTNDGKIGKVTAVVDTGVTGTCAAF